MSEVYTIEINNGEAYEDNHTWTLDYLFTSEDDVQFWLECNGYLKQDKYDSNRYSHIHTWESARVSTMKTYKQNEVTPENIHDYDFLPMVSYEATGHYGYDIKLPEEINGINIANTVLHTIRDKELIQKFPEMLKMSQDILKILPSLIDCTVNVELCFNSEYYGYGNFNINWGIELSVNTEGEKYEDDINVNTYIESYYLEDDLEDSLEHHVDILKEDIESYKGKQ